MHIYDRHQEEREEREKVREITQAEWEDLIIQLTETHERLNELEERVGHSELTLERLEHSEDKEYLESIERCKGCEKLGINVKECRKYFECDDEFKRIVIQGKVKEKRDKIIESFWKEQEKDLEERQSIYNDTCKRCSQFDTMTNECCVNANCKDEYLIPDKPCKTCKWCKENMSKEYICENKESKFWKMLVNKDESTCENWEIKTCETCKGYKGNGDMEKCDNTKSILYKYLVAKDTPFCDKWEEKEDKNWIVHRTLRKKDRETYIGKSFLGINLNGFTYNIKEAKRFTIENAIAIRDELNKTRIGKRYLWVVSKV